jgi:hypothetical protein
MWLTLGKPRTDTKILSRSRGWKASYDNISDGELDSQIRESKSGRQIHSIRQPGSEPKKPRVACRRWGSLTPRAAESGEIFHEICRKARIAPSVVNDSGNDHSR